MIRGTLTVATLASVILFPWPVTALLVVSSSLAVPLLPVVAGIFSDTLYYTHAAGMLPLGTIAGAAVTLAAYLVRNRLKPSIIEG
ncbi:MAG TPA: hypothetical protein VMV50_00215 [Candidatus Paceibacterota bacterium]|nr:hypothetical protein [Candidatus Paceibacterota bacterium]